MNEKTKKLIILNLPYVIIGLFCSNIGEAWQIAVDTDLGSKIISFCSSMGAAWSNPMPSLHPFDLCIGLAIDTTFRLVVYVRSKNAKSTAAMRNTARPGGGRQRTSRLLLTRTLRITSS